MADPNMVATNAHVVAGVDTPAVHRRQRVHPATVTAFDPDLDFAVLQGTGLAASPLPLNRSLAPRDNRGSVGIPRRPEPRRLTCNHCAKPDSCGAQHLGHRHYLRSLCIPGERRLRADLLRGVPELDAAAQEPVTTRQRCVIEQ